jgi:outer membrane lipopolysaccharide assembly protein LptE/RlpB
MFRRLAALLLLALSLVGTACSHYRLGTGAQRDFDTLYIAPVATRGVLPQSTALLSTQIREAFLRDGRVRLVNTPEEADAVLHLELDSLRREALTRLPSDAGLARKFGLSLEAQATLRAPDQGKTWFADRRLRVERQIFTEDGSASGPASLQALQQIQAEHAITPHLGQALAEQVRAAVLDTW